MPGIRNRKAVSGIAPRWLSRVALRRPQPRGGVVLANQLDLEHGQELPQPVPVGFTINGTAVSLELDPRVTLASALREHLGLTGTKIGCDQGQCGACTVLVNGRRINSCLSLAVMHDGDAITTIEGIGTPELMHPIQQAFIEHDGFQCGYCTPGQILSSLAVLEEIKAGIPSHVTGSLTAEIPLSDEEIRERMAGNLCRCAAYPNIIAAIRDYAEAGR